MLLLAVGCGSNKPAGEPGSPAATGSSGTEDTGPVGDTDSGDAPPEDDTPGWSDNPEGPALTFFAADLPDSVRTGVDEGLAAAAAVWGRYGPLEYWVMGLDDDAAFALIDEHCAMRDAAGHHPFADCVEHHTEEGMDHNLIAYLRLGQMAVETDLPYGSMGRNGMRDWGIHLFSSSYPWGFGDVFDYVSPYDETKTVFHEYFHAVQHAHIESLNHRERDALLGPTWFVEGGAEYMATVATSKGWADGSLAMWDGSEPTPFAQQMRWKLDGGLQNRDENCPGMSIADIDYSDPCSYAAYELGAWGIAYLHSISSEDRLVDVFYPRLETVGWDAAFEEAFGLTPDQFYVDFEVFLTLSRGDQMAILPAL